MNFRLKDELPVDSKGFKSLSNPFTSKEFKREQEKWRKKLVKDGFQDLEDASGNLKSPDRRTISFHDRDQVSQFYRVLDWLMACYPQMPSFDRRVMSLYSEGLYVKKIVRRCKASDKHVRNVIKRYKYLVLAIIKMLNDTDNPHPLKPASQLASEVTANADDRVQNKAA